MLCDDNSNVGQVAISEQGTKSPASTGGISSYKRFDINLLFLVLLCWSLNSFFCFYFCSFFLRHSYC
jgi:hypothetical protein